MSPEADGLERERRLQRCRVAFREPPFREQVRMRLAFEWSEALVCELEWIDDLAASGHWGAIRLRDRIRASTYCSRGRGRLPRATIERLVARIPKAAEAYARAECLGEAPDLGLIAHWLEAGGKPGLAAEIREARALAGELSLADFELMSGYLELAIPGLILQQLAERRFGRPGQASVPGLLVAAARRGHIQATRQPLAAAARRAQGGGAPPDFDEILRWLEAGGRTRAVAELREAHRLAGALGARDFERIEEWLGQDAASGELLAILASDRLEAGEARDAANAMLERATALGSPRAAIARWDRDWPLAADQRAFIEEWTQRSPLPVHAHADCLRIALAMDRGEHPRPATPEEVSRFYAWAHAPGPHDAPLTGSRCYQIATHLDPRRGGGGRDAALSRRWCERGIEMADDQCLDYWLVACVLGHLGIAPDPAAAHAMLERWKARGGDLERSGWRLFSSARAMLGHARERRAAAPDEAQEWLRLAAAIGLPEAKAAWYASTP